MTRDLVQLTSIHSTNQDTQNKTPTLNTRLSGFYFFYFCALGALVPYWSVYLQWLSFNAFEIGSLTAAIMLTRIIAPNFWGYLSDATQQRTKLVKISALLALLCFLPVLFSRDFWGLLLASVAFSFFWNGLLAQFEVVTLKHLGNQPQKYSQVRLWGSVGFILAVLGLGAVIDASSPEYLPWLVLAFFAGLALVSFTIPKVEEQKARGISGSFWHRLKERPVWAFFLAGLLLQLSFGPYYTFYSLYLGEYGFNKTQVGALWALGVLAEVFIFTRMHRLLPRFGVVNLLVVSLLLTALRWCLLGGFACSWWLMITLQLLHAFSFGVIHASSIDYIRRNFSDVHQAQAQAFYSACCFGVGGALGAWLSGLFYLGAGTVFIGAGVVCLVAALIVYVWMREPCLERS